MPPHFHDSDEFFRSDLNVFSQEVRLASTGTGARSDGWPASSIRIGHCTRISIRTSPIAMGGIALTKYEQKANSLGEFGQANYQFTIAWKRRSACARTTRRANSSVSIPAFWCRDSFRPSPARQAARPPRICRPESSKSTTRRAGDTLMYASVSRGVKSGGFTAHNTLSAPRSILFRPEKLTAYEVGVKSDVTRPCGSTRRRSTTVPRSTDPRARSRRRFAVLYRSVRQRQFATDRRRGRDQWQPIARLLVLAICGLRRRLLHQPILEQRYAGRRLQRHVPLERSEMELRRRCQLRHGLSATTRSPLESNYSFHDTYSQFYLLGSNDFTVPKYWLANANLTLSPASGGPWTAQCGAEIFSTAATTSLAISSCPPRKCGAGRRACDVR